MSTITPDDAVTAADLAAEIGEIRGQLREFNARHQAPQQVPTRPLTEICQNARRATCAVCWQTGRLPCVTHPQTGADGYHIDRLGRAYQLGYITSRDLDAALSAAAVVTAAAVIYDAPDGER
jgi:hypothetical protein